MKKQNISKENMAKEILKHKPHIVFEHGIWLVYASKYSVSPRCSFGSGCTVRDLWKCSVFHTIRLPGGKILYRPHL